jgi:hypothetical protein
MTASSAGVSLYVSLKSSILMDVYLRLGCIGSYIHPKSVAVGF